MSNSQTFTLPTMFPSNNTEMDPLSGPVPNNYDKVRDRNLFTNRSVSRNSLISSTMSSVAYYERMVNNGMDIDKGPVESTFALFYNTEQEKAIYISKVAEQQGNMRPKGGNLEAPNSNSKHVPMK